MREGIDRQGRHLYPVLPYPHFIHATDEDLDALYAFVMTRQPVTQTTPPNQLSFPFSSRPLLKVWNALFLSGGVWQPEASQSTEWNRGAYLVDAVGHYAEEGKLLPGRTLPDAISTERVSLV